MMTSNKAKYDKKKLKRKLEQAKNDDIKVDDEIPNKRRKNRDGQPTAVNTDNSQHEYQKYKYKEMEIKVDGETLLGHATVMDCIRSQDVAPLNNQTSYVLVQTGKMMPKTENIENHLKMIKVGNLQDLLNGKQKKLVAITYEQWQVGSFMVMSTKYLYPKSN